MLKINENKKSHEKFALFSDIDGTLVHKSLKEPIYKFNKVWI